MYFKKADPYCEDLGGELGTIENEKDAIFANYAYGKSKIARQAESNIKVSLKVEFKSSAWLKSVSVPPDVFPYAENYNPSAQGQWWLERAESMCGFEGLDMVSPPS